MQIVTAILNFLGTGAGALMRWIRANWGYALALLAICVLLLAAARIFLPAGVFLSLREALVQRAGLSPEFGTFVGLLGAALIIAVNALLITWIVLGRKPEAAAMAVVVIAVVGFAPTLLRANFDADGKPQKWVWRDERGVLHPSAVERSPSTGERLEALTPELVREIERQGWKIPKLLRGHICSIDFFNATTGAPQVWYGGADSNGNVRLYDGPGHDIRTSEELRPVHKTLASNWTQACG